MTEHPILIHNGAGTVQQILQNCHFIAGRAKL
jgi:hypothetical protein